YCKDCLSKQQKINELEEENVRLKARLRYQERTAKEGYFGSSTPSSKITCIPTARTYPKNPAQHRFSPSFCLTGGGSGEYYFISFAICLNLGWSAVRSSSNKAISVELISAPQNKRQEKNRLISPPVS
ncbi:MAG TPA: hypothetical protein VMX13_16365, partial [Sedimentisphaerales bacterium]|nr:hypothetical protein [Sedimentisphaerales bacterium]